MLDSRARTDDPGGDILHQFRPRDRGADHHFRDQHHDSPECSWCDYFPLRTSADRVLTFLCGLLPIIGNIMSNTSDLVGVAFTMSPKMALIALVFLVAIHKLEYFLNSKIIGDRIKNPMWLTLVEAWCWGRNSWASPA